MNLLDAFKQYIRDAMPGGALNPEWTPERVDAAKGLLSVTPVAGDAISLYDAGQSAQRGEYGNAAVGLLNVLPFMALPMYKAGKQRLTDDLTKGKGSGDYPIGYVTEGQKKAFSRQFGRPVNSNEVMMTDKATAHVHEKHVIGDGKTPAQVVGYGDSAMAKRSDVDTDPSKAYQYPSLVNRGLLENGKRYSARMPMGLDDDGVLFVRSIYPEGLKTKNPAR